MIEDFEDDESLDGENTEDESEIVDDADETAPGRFAVGADRVGKDSRRLSDLPDEFIRGDRDVKDQMDQTDRRIIGNFIKGRLEDRPDYGSLRQPSGRLDEEVLTETELGVDVDEEGLENPSGTKTHANPSTVPLGLGANRTNRRGDRTGALTDIGEGRSGVTRFHGKEESKK